MLRSRAIRTFLLNALVFSVVDTKVFEPCELAQHMYTKLSTKYGFSEFMNKRPETIPTLVCIAAYHNFNSTLLVTTDDHKAHQGIFGIVPKRYSLMENFLDDNIDDDLEYFIEEVLYEVRSGELIRNDIIFNFYRTLCQRFTYSHEEYCHLNEYVFGNYAVLIPDDKELLFKCYQNPQEKGKRKRCLPRY
ncbi:hypothetical protein GE061_001582 [Apolygus lucorum]|uniref:Uncharacterized protein n=1 Tax=Apolygus lucorum TaxID=248454 RepID=A0A6A4K7D5_APOLU|nr:hypothetical protein GE061_001582 [Apolygus lucorum]